MDSKPHAPSCERNRDPILEVLRERFADRRRVLEIGSGTGQHAVHFAAALPHLQWQCSDRAEHLPGIGLWLQEAALPNLDDPVRLDVSTDPFPTGDFDAVFTANTLHIMSWSEVERCFAGIANLARRSVAAHGLVLTVYGPFNYRQGFTSDSNREFDAWLRARGAHMGIRDFEAVDALAHAAGLSLVEDKAMPANNRCVSWAVASMHLCK